MPRSINPEESSSAALTTTTEEEDQTKGIDIERLESLLSIGEALEEDDDIFADDEGDTVTKNSSSSTTTSDDETGGAGPGAGSIRRSSFSRKAAKFAAKGKTNRETYGTWKHSMDFSFRMVVYIIGIYNFFRFPHMCYKYGFLTFFIPYFILMVVVGVPIIFMECTIGQFYGVGSATAFGQLAPILSGVSQVLAWNSLINCWIYGLILTWTRTYSGGSMSCLKAWTSCYEEHYFNTPYCYTGVLDDCCSGHYNKDYPYCPPELQGALAANNSHDLRIYYNFQCVEIEFFCKTQGPGWSYGGGKKCKDPGGKEMTIYKRRHHAAEEYLYGFVLGMRRSYVGDWHHQARDACRKQDPKWSRKNFPNLPETRKRALQVCAESQTETDTVKSLFMTEGGAFAAKVWSDKGQQLKSDPQSSAYGQLLVQAVTTVIFITYFLYIDILDTSAFAYVMVIVPFGILLYVTVESCKFAGAAGGLADIFSLRGIGDVFTNPELWADALIHVLITSGVANGGLVSLSSFNKYKHSYLFDIWIVTFLNMVTSILATVMVFCTISHYIYEYEIFINFEDFAKTDATYSSVDFGFLTYSYFLTLIDQRDMLTLMFFFMFSSFPTDTCIRFAQTLLDTAAQILPRMRHHSLMALVATCFFYLMAILPVTRNGGIIFFLRFEYFSHHFAIPIVVLIQVIAVAWVYRAERLYDDATLMGMNLLDTSKVFRWFIVYTLKYVQPALMFLLLVWSCLGEDKHPIKHTAKQTQTSAHLIGGIFSITPFLLFLFSVATQLLGTPKARWKQELLPPKISWDRVHHAQKKLRKQKAHDKKRQDELFRRFEMPTENRLGIRHKAKRKTGMDSKTDLSRQGSALSAAKGKKKGDTGSIGSDEIASWKSYIFWAEFYAYFEDWPGRLDDSEIESEPSSVESTDDESSNED